MERFEDALTLLDLGDTARATELLVQLVAQTPAHATLHVLLAKAYEQQHHWSDALASWQTAYLLLPDAPLVQQGSLRAARVLAALRTMTSPVPSAPPSTPESAYPEPNAPAAQAPAFTETAGSGDEAIAEVEQTPVEEPTGEMPEPAWEEGSSETPDEVEEGQEPPSIEAPPAAPEAERDEAAAFPEAEASPETEALEDEAEDPDPGTTTEEFGEFDYEVVEDGDAAPEASTEATDVTEATAAWTFDEDAPVDVAPESPSGSEAPTEMASAAPVEAAPAEAAPTFELEEDEDVFFDPPLAAPSSAPPEAAEEGPGLSAEAPTLEEPAPTAPTSTPAPGIVLPTTSAGAAPPEATPASVDETVRGPYEPFDLDDLIAQLSGAGRIVPSETPPPPPAGLDEDAVLDSMVSPTLARIHAAQGQFAEAARIYDRLAEQEPARASEYRAEAAAMRAKGKV